MPYIPPEQWRSLFKTVDSAEIAASLLDYSTYWRTPDGSERMGELTMQQAVIAADHVIADLNDRINRQVPPDPTGGVNRDHGCDSGAQEHEDQRWRDEEREHFEAADRRDPWTILLDQCERIVQVHEHLRMDTDEDEATRVSLVETTRNALGQAREFVASLTSWLDEQIVEADRNGWASNDPDAPRVRENNAVARFAREVRARLGGDDDTTTVREG